MFEQVCVLCAISFLDLFAIGLTVPLLSNHIREIGGSHLFVGVVGSIYSGIQLISGPVVGSWSDVRGRKPVLIITLLISSFCYWFIGVTSSIYLFLLARIILGVTKHTQTLCKVLIADIVPKKQQSAVHGYTTAISMAGFVIGPLIGGHLSELKHGFFYVCLITSILFLINAGLTILIPNQNTLVNNMPIDIYKEITKAVKDLSTIEWFLYWDIFSTKLFHSFAASVFFSYLSVVLKETYEVSQRQIGYIISFQSLASVFSGLLVGRIKNKFYKKDIDHTKRHFHMFVIFTFSFVFLFFSSNIMSFVMAMIPFAISNVLLRIVQTDIVLSRSHENDKGSLTGSSASIASLARLAAPLSSGLVSNVWGLSGVTMLSLVTASVGTFVARKLTVKQKAKR